MLKKAFNCRLFEAIDATYPGKFKKWQIGDHVKNDHWTKEEGILAVKWLIEDKLKWNDKDIKENYSKQIYQDYNNIPSLCDKHPIPRLIEMVEEGSSEDN